MKTIKVTDTYHAYTYDGDPVKLLNWAGEYMPIHEVKYRRNKEAVLHWQTRSIDDNGNVTAEAKEIRVEPGNIALLNPLRQTITLILNEEHLNEWLTRAYGEYV